MAKAGGIAKAQEFLLKGGLPGICFLRSSAMRVRKMRSHIKTILDRDLRQVIRTDLDYLSLKTFLEELALRQGRSFELSALARDSRISINTARKLLSGLESVFLIRTVRKTGTSAGRVIYFEDQGQASFLLAERGLQLGAGHFRVSDWVRCLFQQVLAQLNYGKDLQGTLTTYETRGGGLMDLVIQFEGHTLGLSVGTGNTASPSQIKSAQSFRKQHPKSRVFLLHLGEASRTLDERLYEVPIGAFF